MYFGYIFVVKIRQDFYKDLPEYTKYYTKEYEAEVYEEEMLLKDWKMPFFVYREQKLAVIDNDKNTHFVLNDVQTIVVNDHLFMSGGNDN